MLPVQTQIPSSEPQALSSVCSQELGLGGFLEGSAASSQHNQDEQHLCVEKAFCLLFFFHIICLGFLFFPSFILSVLPL